VQQGIGINSGQIVVGNIGSKKRMKYGVVGRNVNLTSRIESYTVGGQIFISENTLDECGRHLLRIDDEMEVMPKGVKKPITIYEVGGIRGEFGLFLPEKVEVELPDLPRPFPVQLTILEGKHASDEAHHGTVIRMLDSMAEIQADVLAEKLMNLKIAVFTPEGDEIATDLYAKITGKVSDHPIVFRVRFTSIPPEADGFLKGIAAQERTS
jgi:adenylate cyclase